MVKTGFVYLTYMFVIQKSDNARGRQAHLYFIGFQYVVIIAVWLFVIIHAFRMDITNDEAYSFFLIKTNYYRAMPGTANTHWLNSFFMKVFNVLFGNQPGFLRLHSVLSFPFFAFGMFRLSGLIKNRLTQIVSCSILLFNPYILDFFSLARGYAMALTFQVWLIIFLLEAVRSDSFEYKKWLRVLLFAVLMIGANLSYFYSFVGVAGFFALLILSRSYPRYSLREKQVRNIAILFSIIGLLAIANLLFIKYYGKDLEYGGREGLIQSLISSVSEGSLYFASHTPDLLSIIAFYTSFFLLLVSVIYFTVWAFKKGHFNSGLILAFPILSIFVLNIVFHLLFNTPFLQRRTALQWLPAGTIFIFLCLDRFTSKVIFNRYASAVLKMILVAMILFHFWDQANKHYCFDWREQSEASKCLHDLTLMHPRHPAIHTLMGGVYLGYYRIIDKNIEKLSVTGFDELKFKSCAPDEIRRILQFDYIIVSSFLLTLDCLNRSKISFEIIKEYVHTSDKLIKINAFKDGN